MHYDDQFPELNADMVHDDFEESEPQRGCVTFDLKGENTIRGLFIWSKPKRGLILNGFLTAITAALLFVSAYNWLPTFTILSAMACAWFGLKFVEEVRKYFRKTEGVLWSTATFPDGEVRVNNGESLTCQYTISADTDPPTTRETIYRRWQACLKYLAPPWGPFMAGARGPGGIVVDEPPPPLARAVIKPKPPLYEPDPFVEGFNFTEAFNPFRDELLSFREAIMSEFPHVRDSDFYRLAYRTDKRHFEAVEKVLGSVLDPLQPVRLYGIPLVCDLDEWTPREREWTNERT